MAVTLTDDIRKVVREIVTSMIQAEKEAINQAPTLYENIRRKLIEIFGTVIPRTPGGRYQWERVITIVLRELGGCATVDELLLVLGIDRSSKIYSNMRRALAHLTRKGTIKRVTRGFYCIGKEPPTRLEAVRA